LARPIQLSASDQLLRQDGDAERLRSVWAFVFELLQQLISQTIHMIKSLLESSAKQANCGKSATRARDEGIEGVTI
jgi:hypothetical protein